MRYINAFTIAGKDIEKGIQLSQTPRGDLALWLGTPENHHEVVLNRHQRGGRPRIEGSLLMQGSPAKTSNDRGQKVIDCSPNWGGLMLRVIARDLDFGIEPFVPNLNFNAGGEGLKAFQQFGRPKEVHIKDQLFAIREGIKLYLIDKNAAIITVSCVAGEPVVSETPRFEIVQYLERYGLNVPLRQSIVWASRTLEQLGEQARADNLALRADSMSA